MWILPSKEITIHKLFYQVVWSKKDNMEESRRDTKIRQKKKKKKANRELTLWMDYTLQNKLRNLAMTWGEKSVTY